MKKKLSVVKSQQKIQGSSTHGSSQPTTHKILSQNKQKRIGGIGLSSAKNKENDTASTKTLFGKQQYRYESAFPATKEQSAKELNDRSEESLNRPFSKKINPLTTKNGVTSPKFGQLSSQRQMPFKRQFMFPHHGHSNSQKPVSAKNKPFNSIRRSEANVLGVTTEDYKQPKQSEPMTTKNDRKESVWGKKQLVLQSDKADKKTKDTQIQPATTKGKNSSLSKFLTQLPAPKTILNVHSYSNLFSAVTNEFSSNLYYISTLVQAFSEKCNNTTFMQLARNHMQMTLQVLNITKNIERPLSSNPINDNKNMKNILVFDLDETLIHCNESTDIPHDALMNIVFPNGDSTKAGINVRPHAQETLRQLCQLFDVYIFTASHECYANVVIDYLDPKGTMVKGRYFRDSCYRTPEGLYIKDLRVLGKPLENVILIDNAAYSYAFQLDNGVPIIPFYDDKTDMELKKLTAYLKPLSSCKDIRKHNCRFFKTRHYVNYADPLALISSLYHNPTEQ